MKRAIVVVSVLILSAAGALAQNWPQFRGPAASGVADGQKTPLACRAAAGQHVNSSDTDDTATHKR